MDIWTLAGWSADITLTPGNISALQAKYTNGYVNLPQGVLEMAGTQVLTTQQAAIADVAAGAGDSDGTARAKINAILAMLRTHGIIAT